MAVADNASSSSGGGGDKKKGQSLYADYHKVHPRKISGKYRNIKTFTNWFLLGLYFIGPWIPWPRSGNTPDQAILLDISGRRGYFFFIEIWPQEVYYLTGLLILGAIGLFFVTSLLGRIWCGFTCIQTVWTEWMVAIEKLIEGDRPARMRLDKGPWTGEKFAKKTLKVFIWLLIALLSGWAWVLYFNPAYQTTVDILTLNASAGIYGFIALFGAFVFVLAGWAREQVCIYMCPWPRFQGGMFDEDTLIVTYEEWRGEPRAPGRKGQSFEGRGHCVDCGLCVQVCPTGIDIRQGSQLACIGCGLCIDACNTVMDRFELPRGLITYDSVNNQIARSKGEGTKYRFVRPRTVIYAILLLAVAGFMVFNLATRSRLEVNVLHERSPLFVTLSDGDIRNGYTLKILNMEPSEHTFALSTEDLPGAMLTVVGFAKDPVTRVELPVAGDSVGNFRVYITVPRENLTDKAMDLTLRLENQETGEQLEHETLFAGPNPK